MSNVSWKNFLFDLTPPTCSSAPDVTTASIRQTSRKVPELHVAVASASVVHVEVWTHWWTKACTRTLKVSHSGSCLTPALVSLSPPAASLACEGIVGSGVGVQVVDSPLLTQQIEAQRLCIKHLKNENNRLKVQT